MELQPWRYGDREVLADLRIFRLVREATALVPRFLEDRCRRGERYRSIDIQVSRLRRKIEEDPRNPTLIKTVRGGGYMFTADVEASGGDR